MPIAEPSAEFGFWPRVKALSGWPQTDEDAVAKLADGWTKAAEGFTAAGSKDTSGISQAWGDPAGTAFAGKTAQTGKAAAEAGQSMRKMAAAVTGFADEVKTTKTNIANAVTPNISVYSSYLHLPRGAGQAAAENLVKQVAAEVKKLLDQAVSRISGVASGQQAAPPPPAAAPEKGLDYQKVGDYASILAGIGGALSLTPAAPVAVPITVAASLVAFLAHGKAMLDKSQDPNQSVTAWDWVALAGDAAGGYGALKVLGAGARGAFEAAAAPNVLGGPGAADVFQSGVNAATREGSMPAQAWQYTGQQVADKLGKSAEFGQGVATAGHQAASALPQAPAIAEQFGGKPSEEEKNVSSSLNTAASIYHVVR
ncbi:WXG100-like domain-containing protein [Amycolatopsis silviterrae]|uniref:Outer membrane channel protein CpnT-like N-terminal domain-containing protein n=1 Tax=Amycolatopsis silviterrae TaxID=1656914 RepID=A0ABW5H410_9PSEU